MAVSGLAYYGYRSSAELAAVERAIMVETLTELAKEKVLAIEAEVTRVESLVFASVSLDNLSESQEQLRKKQAPVSAVLVLDEGGEIVPGGFFTSREDEDTATFRELFEAKISADLNLSSPPEPSFHLHRVYDGRPYLFGVLRRQENGKTYYIVVDADLSYLVGSVFPQVFDVRSPRLLYQVIDEDENIIYGFSFAGIKLADVTTQRFPEALVEWRLRVTQRDADELAARGDKQKRVDLIVISVALLVVVCGVVVMLFAMRRERRLNQLKSDFISNVSHELKTPLSIISMFGELLSMGRVRSPDQATEYAEIIRRESVRLSRLIDNVLDFSKIERGKGVYEFKSGEDLGEVVSRALEITDHRLETAKMTLELEIAEDLPSVRLDANAMTLAVLNLVDNAIKYAAVGERVSVRVRQLKRDKREGVALFVRDFGPGVPVGERQQIFERFYRAREVRLKPIRGSGIGLALVTHITKAHNGSISVLETADGEPGSCFRLWIPAEER